MDFLLIRHHDQDDEKISFKGEITMADIARLNLTRFDQALLDDVGGALIQQLHEIKVQLALYAEIEVSLEIKGE